jgi:hypothetical protein
MSRGTAGTPKRRNEEVVTLPLGDDYNPPNVNAYANGWIAPFNIRITDLALWAGGNASSGDTTVDLNVYVPILSETAGYFPLLGGSIFRDTSSRLNIDGGHLGSRTSEKPYRLIYTDFPEGTYFVANLVSVGTGLYALKLMMYWIRM